MKKRNTIKYVPSKNFFEDNLQLKQDENNSSIENIKKIISDKRETSKKGNIFLKFANTNDKKKKIIKLSVIISIIAIIAFIVWKVLSLIFEYQQEEIDITDIGINKEYFETEFTGELSKITNIALLGVDANNISDAMLIASINPNKDSPTIKLISIARDTLTPIYGVKNKIAQTTKINEAYNFGGPSTTLRTINKNFNLNVTNFISIDMKGLAKIIDGVGGIDIKITEQEKNQINGIIHTTPILKSISNKHINSAGDVHLNGPQAVAFARIRKQPTKDGVSDDFGRCDRQKEVLLKIFEKVKKTDKSKIVQLIQPCLKYTKTSYSLPDAIKLLKELLSKKYKMEFTTIPTANMPLNAVDRDYRINSGGTQKSTVLYDLKYAGKIINDFIYKNINPIDNVEKNPPKSLNINQQIIPRNIPKPTYHVNRNATKNDFNFAATKNNKKETKVEDKLNSKSDKNSIDKSIEKYDKKIKEVEENFSRYDNIDYRMKRQQEKQTGKYYDENNMAEKFKNEYVKNGNYFNENLKSHLTSNSSSALKNSSVASSSNSSQKNSSNSNSSSTSSQKNSQTSLNKSDSSSLKNKKH